jgi:tetratricopeptide (TPR) repeat protein
LKALVSGQAGVAVILEKGRATSMRADSFALTAHGPHDWPYLLADSDDVVELCNVSIEDVRRELDLASRKDGALHLILILLDRKSSDEGRKQSAPCLEELFSDGVVYRFIENRLFVAPLPGAADLEGALKIARGSNSEKVENLLQEIQRNQDAVRLCRRAWDVLSPDLFGSASKKEGFGFRAVEVGLFRQLAILQSSDLSKARDIEVPGFPESRDVVVRWIREIKAADASLAIMSAPKRLSNERVEESQPKGPLTFKRFRIPLALAAAVCILIAFFLVDQPSTALAFATAQPGVVVARATRAEPSGAGPLARWRARMLFNEGSDLQAQGRFAEALEAYKHSLTTSESLSARLNEGAVLYTISRYLEAEKALTAGFADSVASGDRDLQAGFALNLGNVFSDLARFSDAEREFDICDRIARERGRTDLEAAAISGTATVNSYRGMLFSALQGYRRALDIYTATDNRDGAANSNLNIGSILIPYQQPIQAARYMSAAAEYFKRSSTFLGRANFKLIDGTYIFAAGGDARLMDALRSFEEAKALYQQCSNRIGEARAEIAIGEVLRAQGSKYDVLRRQGGKFVDPHTGLLINDIEHYDTALSLGKDSGLPMVQIIALIAAGEAYTDSENWSSAIAPFQGALKLCDAVGANGAKMAALQGLSDLFMSSGNKAEALAYSKRSLAAAEQTGDPYLKGSAHEALAHMYGTLGDETSAGVELEQASALYSEVGSELSARRVQQLLGQIKRVH